MQVWEVSSKAVRATLQGFHVRGVSLLTFSSDGDLLLSVGQVGAHPSLAHTWSGPTYLTSVVYIERPKQMRLR